MGQVFPQYMDHQNLPSSGDDWQGASHQSWQVGCPQGSRPGPQTLEEVGMSSKQIKHLEVDEECSWRSVEFAVLVDAEVSAEAGSRPTGAAVDAEAEAIPERIAASES